MCVFMVSAWVMVMVMVIVGVVFKKVKGAVKIRHHKIYNPKYPNPNIYILPHLYFPTWKE
jgi:hypothetical protein